MTTFHDLRNFSPSGGFLHRTSPAPFTSWCQRRVRGLLAIGCISAIGVAPVGHAQGNTAVTVTPTGAIDLTDTVPTATVTFTNPTGHTKDVWFKPFFAKGVTFHGDNYPSVQDAGGQALDSAWLTTFPSAVPWLSGFPQHFVLGPHENKAISLQIVPPASLPNGRYRALFQYVQSFDSSDPGLILHGYVVLHYQRTAYHSAAGAAPPTFRLGSAAVTHTPTVVVLTDHTPTSSVTLTNPTDSAVALWLAVDFPDVTQFNSVLDPIFSNTIGGDPFPGGFPGGVSEKAWHNEIPDAELWLGGFPQHVVVPPHGTQAVPLQIVPYPSLENGQYYARLHYAQTPQRDGQSSNVNAFVVPNGAVDIVYTKGPSLPPLQLADGAVSTQSDGTLHGCMTVHQPGIGMVGMLHAIVHDTHGNAVHANEPVGNTTPWEFTTRFASLETLQGVDVTSASLRCVQLPKFAPGQYVLQFEVVRIDDVTKEHPVKLDIPFTMP